MAWTRIDDKFLMNPKVQSVGVHGMALYLSGLIYCNSNLTDGFIMDGVLPMICGIAYQTPARHIANRLVDVNLWELVAGGYQIHDFLTFNKSKQEIEQLNKQRANNGAKGGRLPKQTETDLFSKQVSKQPPINPKPLTLNPKPLKELKTAAAFSGKNSDLYSQFEAITPVNDHLRTALDSLVNIYSTGWVKDAIAEGVEHNAHTFGYLNTILERWKRDGRNGNGHKPVRQEGGSLEYFRKLSEDMKASEK